MKKFHFHLDATIIIGLVFAASLVMNFLQYRIYKELAAENVVLAQEKLIGNLNLGSCRDALAKHVSGQEQ